MMLIRMTITILLIATFKATVEGYGLPIFYSLDNEWKSSADDTLGYNNAPQSQALSTWGNFRKKSHKLFPSVVSNSSSSLNSVLENLYLYRLHKFSIKLCKIFFQSPLDTIKWRLPLVQRRNGGGATLRGVGQMNDKRDQDLKIAMDGLRRYFGRI